MSLSNPVMDSSIDLDLSVDGTRLAAVYRTRHPGGRVAITVVHLAQFGHRIGGARFVAEQNWPRFEEGRPWTEGGHIREVAKLAVAMTWKNALAGLPADGQKSVINCPHGVPTTVEERASILGAHIAFVAEHDRGVIFGPDMNVPEEVQNILGRLGQASAPYVTGQSPGAGGIGIDHRGFTAHGLFAGLQEVLTESARQRGAAIQGFGAVGAHLALLLHGAGVPVVAVATREGMLSDSGGIDVPALFAALGQLGESCVSALPGEFRPDPNTIFEVPCGILVPAARTSVLATHSELGHVREENRDVRDIAIWHASSGAEIVLEGANHPLTEAAEAYLDAYGVVYIPDYVGNCGGLIGCLLEWAHRHLMWESPELVERLGKASIEAIGATVQRNVRFLRAAQGGGARHQARALAESERARLLAEWGQKAAGRSGHEVVARFLRDSKYLPFELG